MLPVVPQPGLCEVTQKRWVRAGGRSSVIVICSLVAYCQYSPTCVLHNAHSWKCYGKWRFWVQMGKGLNHTQPTPILFTPWRLAACGGLEEALSTYIFILSGDLIICLTQNFSNLVTIGHPTLYIVQFGKCCFRIFPLKINSPFTFFSCKLTSLLLNTEDDYNIL